MIEISEIKASSKIIGILSKATSRLETSEMGKDKNYEAKAVKKLFNHKFLPRALQQETGYARTIISKYLAFEILQISRDIGIASDSMEWMLLFWTDNPESATDLFKKEFFNLLANIKADLERIQKTELLVLAFDTFEN